MWVVSTTIMMQKSVVVVVSFTVNNHLPTIPIHRQQQLVVDTERERQHVTLARPRPLQLQLQLQRYCYHGARVFEETTDGIVIANAHPNGEGTT